MSDERTITRYLKFCILGHRLCGLWTEEDHIFGTNFYWVYYLLVSVVFMGAFNLSQFAYLLTAFDDLEKFATTAYLFAGCLMANVKAIFYCKHFPLLKEILHRLDQEDFQPKNGRQKRLMFENMKTHVWAQGIFLACSVIICTLWVTFPLMLSEEKKLPFHAWYPFDEKGTTAHILCYIHQSISIWFIVALNSSSDLMTVGMIAYVGAECDILSDTLRNLHEFAEPRTGNGDEGGKAAMEGINAAFVACVKHHREILKFAKSANRIFNTYVFILFATSLTAICLTLFELSIVRISSAEAVTLVVYETAIFYELLVYCWFGNELMVKSDRIAYALYDSDVWIDGSQEFRRNMVFFMLRTNERPIRMYCIDFFVLSLSTFTYILRASWSFFAMLRQVHGKEA